MERVERKKVATMLAPTCTPEVAERVHLIWSRMEGIFEVWRTEKEVDEFSDEELQAYRSKEEAFSRR